MFGEAVIFAEGIGDLRQRLAEMRQYQVPVGNVVRNFAQTVHIVGKGDQLCLDAVSGQGAKGVSDHACARHFAERAEVRRPEGP